MHALARTSALIHYLLVAALTLTTVKLLVLSPVRAADVQLVVDVDKPGPRISPQLIGIFFEDINFGGDAGLNAELIKNGGFEFPVPLMGWQILNDDARNGSCKVSTEAPRTVGNPHYLHFETTEAGTRDRFGAVNEGFRGIGLREGETYDFSVWARSTAGAMQTIQLRLVDPNDKLLAEAILTVSGSEWKLTTATLTPSATEPRAKLKFRTTTPGALDLDMVSLYPRNTWKGRPHGLRADLVQLLADLKPAFFRFPGGCIVEGSQLKYRYQWKATLGDLAERRLIVNRWNDEFRHRPTPDYYQSFALGFFEYFQMSEDIGAAPMPIINCGMACQFNSGELAPMDELQPYIDDALDLIEFANGPTTSEWGARRAALGHPEPFGMKLLGIGNEQWGPQYIERYKEFASAIKKTYPDVQLITSAGPLPGDERFHYLWKQLRELDVDIVDEHSYANPDWFRAAATRFDNYPRIGPKVFMGEYAAQSVGVAKPENRNTLQCALAEAAFLTGIERNSDVVTMSSYAPLFGHEDAWQWRPNLIWFDNLQSYATPNYYVQQLFSLHRGDVVLPLRLDDARQLPAAKLPRLYATASKLDGGGVIVKVVNTTAEPAAAEIRLQGAAAAPTTGEAIVIAGEPDDENSIEKTDKLKPASAALQGVGATFTHTFPANSFTVLRMK